MYTLKVLKKFATFLVLSTMSGNPHYPVERIARVKPELLDVDQHRQLPLSELVGCSVILVYDHPYCLCCGVDITLWL